MKLNFKMGALAIAAVAAVSAPAHATIAYHERGDAELIFNLRSYVGSPITDGDDISAAFDLGVTTAEVLSWNGQAGFTRTWDLKTGLVTGTGIDGSQQVGTYGSTWNDLFAFVAPENQAAIEYNVIALNSRESAPNGFSYFTTANVSTFPNLSNSGLRTLAGMSVYPQALNKLDGHANADNGASIATPTSPIDTYFAAINGYGQGDNWLAALPTDSTQKLDVEQNFWYLENSSFTNPVQSTKIPFGFDLNGDGKITGDEFAKWSVNAELGTVTFTSPVPEADTWAMLLAGLGMLGAIVRRRTTSV